MYNEDQRCLYNRKHYRMNRQQHLQVNGRVQGVLCITCFIKRNVPSARLQLPKMSLQEQKKTSGLFNILNLHSQQKKQRRGRIQSRRRQIQNLSQTASILSLTVVLPINHEETTRQQLLRKKDPRFRISKVNFVEMLVKIIGLFLYLILTNL